MKYNTDSAHFSKLLKLTLLFFLSLQINVLSAQSHKLDKEISITFNNDNLESVLSKIEKATGYSFSYSPDAITEDIRIDKAYKNKPLREILNEILVKYPIYYKEMGNTILIQADAGAQSGTIKGRIVSSENQEPLFGVNVGLEGTPLGGSTDENGQFIIENIKPGPYTIIATFIGYSDVRRRIIVKGSQVTELDIQLTSSISRLSEVIIVGESEQSDYNSEVSTTAMRGLSPILKTPRSIQVIPGTVIQDQAAEEIRDVVRNVSGIQEDGTYGNTTDNFTIRGFRSRRAILRDGYNFASSRALNANIERVEVLKGPSSILYGRLEPGGLINTVTKKPKYTFGGQFRTFFSDRGAQIFQADLTGPLARNTSIGNLAYRLVAEQENSDYWRNFGERNRTFIAPSLALDYRTGDITLQYEFLDSEQPFDRGQIFFDGKPLDTPPERRFGEAWERLDERINIGTLLWNQRLNDDWQLAFKTAYQHNLGSDRQARPLDLTIDANGRPTGELIRAADGSTDREYENFYATLNALGKVKFLGWDHTLLFGVDYEDRSHIRDVVEEGPEQGGFNIFNPVYGQLTEDNLEPVVPSDFVIEFQSFGLYVQNSIDFNDKWTAVIGGRFEDYSNFGDINFRRDNPPFNDSKGNTFLPTAGLLFRPSTSLSFYGSYGESFQPNRVPVLPTANQPVGELDPQEGISYEIGAKAKLFSGLNLTLALFDMKRTNVVRVSLDDNNDPVFNISDDVKSKGIELDLSGTITPNWNMIAAYSYIDASDSNSALRDEVQNVAEHSGSFSTTYRLTDGKLKGLEFGGGTYFIGERYGGGSEGDGLQTPFFLDAYTQVDLHASYTFPIGFADSDIRLQVNLRNMFDEEFFPSATNALLVRAGQGRTLFGSISWEF